MKLHEESTDLPISTVFEYVSGKKIKPKNDSKEPFFKCRYVIACLGFLFYFLSSYNRCIMSVAIVAMVKHTVTSNQSDACPNLIINATDKKSSYSIKEEGDFAWSPKVQDYILGSYFLGYVIIQMPAGIIAERHGCKWVLFTTCVSVGILTLLIPPVSWLSSYALVAVQVMRGLSQGVLQPSIAILASNWFPKTERGSVYSFMLSSTSLGSFFGSIFTGYLCELPGGWAYSFYAIGLAGLALSLPIFFSVVENPTMHPSISKVELDFILNNQESALHKKRPKRPWSSMLTSIPVYAFAFGYFGHTWSVGQFWTVQSIFQGTILHFPIAENGIMTAITYIVQFVCHQAGTWISFYMQKNKVASVDFLRKFFTYVSGLGFAGCLLGMYFVGCNRSYSIVFSIASMGFYGLGTPGICVVATDMTPTFSGSLQAIISTIGFTSTFILPVIAGYLTDEKQSIGQWNKVFFISIGVVMFCKTVFLVFGSAEVQPWNFVGETTQHEAEKQTELCQEAEGNRKK